MDVLCEFVGALSDLGVSYDRTTLADLPATLADVVEEQTAGVLLHVDEKLPEKVTTMMRRPSYRTRRRASHPRVSALQSTGASLTAERGR